MLTLINANRMTPPIAPVGLDYVAGAVRRAGIEVEVLDLCLADDSEATLSASLARGSPELVGISFRNVEDCFWPGGAWFVPELEHLVKRIRGLTDAPIVIGGVGFSIFPERLVEHTGADFGIRGDGERAVVELVKRLRTDRRFETVDGLIWREKGTIRSNRPAWPEELAVPTARDAVDNATYFRLGGQ
ncbi:MAG: cobalamin B12-binding domain-containing protein, partial [Planctomycetes bacterium]|nr:cobalamin B12-binding domain-containing protein [Planctomycetota bacterium]